VETQEDRLRRMKREREGIASASWEVNPSVPRPTSTAQGTWEPNARPSSNAVSSWEVTPPVPRIAQSTWEPNEKPSNNAVSSWGPPQYNTAVGTWSDQTPEKLVDEITRPAPSFTAKNADGSPNYDVPVGTLPRSRAAQAVHDHQAAREEMARDGESPRMRREFLDEVQGGVTGVSDRSSRWDTGLAAEEPPTPASPSRTQTRADKASAAAAAMSEEEFTDAFKQQMVARDAEMAEERFTETFKRGLVSRDAKLTEEANTNAMIDRIRAARQTGMGDAPQVSALAQQMMYMPDGSKRPVPSRATLDKWADIDAQAGRKRRDGGHVMVPPSPPRQAALAAAPAQPAAVAPPAAAPQDAAAEADAGPLPPVPARPVGLQAPEAPKPADAAVERPAMVPMDANAAVQPEPAPMPSKITPAQRKMEARAKERNMQKNSSMQPHLAQEARDMGIEGVPFHELTGEQITDLRYNAGKRQRDAANAQINDRQSDRNQSREQNIPMALATAQRLQGRGRALLAQAGGLDDADPRKPALQAQGEQMLAQGNSQHATFMNAWDRQSSQHIDMNVMQAARVFGKAGAGIVEGHLRGQQEMARARLVDQGNRDDRKAAEEGLDRRANNRADVDLALADKNITAQEIQQQRDREQRIAELKERERLHGLDQAQRERLAKDERDAAAHRQKLDLNDRQKGREAQAAQNPVPMQPAEQRAQLWGPLKAADSNPDDQTPVQQYVDDFMQTLASQEGLQPQQRQIQNGQVRAWANQHVMSRWENDRLRDSDRGYIRSLVYATDADGNNTGKLKDRSTFVREMGSHYKGSNWASMAAKLGAFYDRLKQEEQESANLTQVGIPDNPVV